MHWVLILMFANGGASAQPIGPYLTLQECEAAYDDANKRNENFKYEDRAWLRGHLCVQVNHWG